MKTFVSIDFETANYGRNTACAVGIIKVKDQVIIQKFFSLIQPPGNSYSENCINVHGISPVNTEHAPNFYELYPLIKNFIDGEHLVCHNASFDIDVLRKCMVHYAIDPDDLSFDYSDTMKLFGGKALDVCCKEFGICLNHHDALSDAEAAACLFMKSNDANFIEYNPTPGIKKESGKRYAKKLNRDLFKKSFDVTENVENPFYQKKVVITGTYINWPERDNLGLLLKRLGADLDVSVSERINYLITGNNPGREKKKKTEDFINNGIDIKIIDENQLLSIINGVRLSRKEDDEWIKVETIEIENGKLGFAFSTRHKRIEK
jgi:DNA polymerase-3 subunit epsilon